MSCLVSDKFGVREILARRSQGLAQAIVVGHDQRREKVSPISDHHRLLDQWIFFK